MADTSQTITNTTKTTTTTLSSSSPSNSNLRPKLYKVKKDLDDYNYLYVEHQDQSINYFDSYLEFTPLSLKRIFNAGFLLNKLLILVLIYCVFYNTIWWFKNSTSNNLAINYQIIDANIFLILVYINFHDFLISNLLLRKISFNILKYLPFISKLKLKIILNSVEILIKILLVILISIYFIYYANYTFNFTLIVLVPHVCFVFYYSYNYEIKFLNYVLFTNNCIPSTSAYTATPTIYPSSSKVRTRQDQVTYTDDTSPPSSTELSTSKPKTSLFGRIRNLYSLIKQIPQTSHIQIQKNNLFVNNTASTSNTCLTSSAISNSNSSINSSSNITSYNTYQMMNSFSSTSPSSTSSTSTVPSSTLTSFSLLSIIKHNCGKDAHSLREETNLFIKIFNFRFKQICFCTFEIVYYNLIIPRLCVPEYMNIRNFEYYSYSLIIILSTFISYWLYYIPLSFLIALNRNAQHLGKWRREYNVKQVSSTDTLTSIDNDSSGSSSQESNSDVIYCWFDTKFYFQGDIVDYMNKYYKCISNYCVSIPNYKLHKKFFNYFNDPFRIITILALFELFSIVLLGLITYQEAKWYNIAVNMLYVILNFHILYILARDWIILYARKYVKIGKDKE